MPRTWIRRISWRATNPAAVVGLGDHPAAAVTQHNGPGAEELRWRNALPRSLSGTAGPPPTPVLAGWSPTSPSTRPAAREPRRWPPGSPPCRSPPSSQQPAATLPEPYARCRPRRPAAARNDRIGECRYGDWTAANWPELADEPLWAAVRRHPRRRQFLQRRSQERQLRHQPDQGWHHDLHRRRLAGCGCRPQSSAIAPTRSDPSKRESPRAERRGAFLFGQGEDIDHVAARGLIDAQQSAATGADCNRRRPSPRCTDGL